MGRSGGFGYGQLRGCARLGARHAFRRPGDGALRGGHGISSCINPGDYLLPLLLVREPADIEVFSDAASIQSPPRAPWRSRQSFCWRNCHERCVRQSQDRSPQTPRGPLLFVNGKETAPTILFVMSGLPNPARYLQVRLDKSARPPRRGVNIVSLDTVYAMAAGRESRPALRRRTVSLTPSSRREPNALIIPRFGITWPPRWWSDRHPDEMMLYDDGSRGIASIHSRVWRKDAAANVAAFVRRLEQKYGGHMLGYHTSGQNTGEWFYDRGWEGRLSGYEPPGREAFRAWLKQKYKTQAALRLAWHSPSASFESIEPPSFRERTRCKAGHFRDPLIEQKVIDFFGVREPRHGRRQSRSFAGPSGRLRRQDHRAVLGYPFELKRCRSGPQPSGHLATSYLLKSPDLDVMCSPVSYLNRAPGGGGFFMAPVDSVQAHGSSGSSRIDTRTCFSTSPRATGAFRP